MKKKTFRLIDICFLTGITIIIDLVAFLMSQNANDSEVVLTYYISFYVTMGLLIMFRWNIYGYLASIVMTLAYCIISSASPTQYFVYLIGAIFMGINLIWFTKGFKNKLQNNFGLLVLYIISGFLLALLGRTIAGLIVTSHFYFLGFASQEGLNLLMCFIIFLVSKKQNGLLVDMNEYLVSLHNKEQ